ncbi:hypothetical protein VTK56DRAFT_9660 [Thermocarpiscus australiensis]
MFNAAKSSKVLGAGHLILNALRALTLIGLAVVMTASWAMIALSGINHRFDFFDSITHFFVFTIAIFLFLSEINLKFFRGWYMKNWPVLGPEHSLAWLGMALVIMGCDIMADLVKPAYSIDTIGLAWWRVILAAGILSLTFGFFNILASIIFRDPERRITARRIRSDGSLAAQTDSKSFHDGYLSDYSSSHHRDNYSQRSFSKEAAAEEEEKPWAVMNRLTRVFNGINPMNFRKSRIQISGPILPQVDGGADCERGPANSRASPIIPDIQRPPTALHPALTGGSRYSQAQYSEAHMDRF